MGLFDFWKRSREVRSESFGSLFDFFTTIGLTEGGVSVTPESAMTATAVYSAVSIIGSAIATLPIHVIEVGSNKVVANHPLERLFAIPNEFMTWPDFMEAYCLNLLTCGNGYAYCERDVYMNPIELLPLRSRDTEPRRDRGRLVYLSRIGGSTTTLPIENVVHTRNMAWEGICGISPLCCGAGAIGLALDLDKFARLFFKNGANIGTVIELPPMKKEAVDEFKRQWRDQYAGMDNSHRTAVAPGLKVHKMGFSPAESQANESRKYQLAEVARIYQIPPHKLGELDRATYSNIEEQSRDFAENTLRRWVIKIEAAFGRTLLREDERDKFKIRINLGAIIRGNLMDQIEALTKGTGGAPIYTQNEAREYLGMQPAKGGDVLLSNLNQAPADKRTLSLLRSIAMNLTTKEANAVRRAAKQYATDTDGFATWAGEFYRSHIETLARALEGTGIPSDTLLEYCRQEGRVTAESFVAGQIEQRIQAIETTGAEQLTKRLVLTLDLQPLGE